MNKKIFLIFIICIISIYSCAAYNTNVKKYNKDKIHYFSSGFVLIYEDNLYKEKVVNKKIDNKKIMVMHSTLKLNTPIKITNPINSKFLITKVNKKANFPKIFNIVISEKISSILDLDVDNPYVEIIELKKNKTFIAKESSIFEEEKNVADKAPVDEIKINDLSKEKTVTHKKSLTKKNFILVISDFYYLDSAKNLRNEIINKIDINKISIKKISNNKYRLLVGPFKNFNALKNTYISLNNLGFEELMIYRE